jgi:hypothetical protein
MQDYRALTPDIGSLVSLIICSCTFDPYALQGGSLRRVSLDALLEEDVGVAARCSDAFTAVSRLEAIATPNVALYQPAVLQQRAQVCGTPACVSPVSVVQPTCVCAAITCINTGQHQLLWLGACVEQAAHSLLFTMFSLQVVTLAAKYGGAFTFRDDTVYDGLALFDKVSEWRLTQQLLAPLP